MGISRGPIREALRDLEAMGLVTCLPYKETVVADVTKEEIVDLLIPIRLQLELYSIEYRLDQFDDGFFSALNVNIARMDQFAADNDIAGFVEAVPRFIACRNGFFGISSILTDCRSFFCAKQNQQLIVDNQH